MSQVITNAFEQYWQSSLAAEQPVVLDEFILADIPNLDITSPIDPDTGLPPAGQIVYRQNVDQRGRINNNAVAYSIVMDTKVGDFSFNAMYLRNKANGVIGMIVYKGRETKTKTEQTTGQTGNSLVKSMLMGYDQAAEATVTNVDAGTWQIDYAARLRGQDEDLRQLASQLYGHHTFIGDGFKVVQEGAAYKVTQGVAIVGGLRIELTQPEVIYPGSKPIGVWVDVYRSGSLLSEHQNHFTLITSVADLTDHLDGNGYQHYVAKLATVQADSTVIDGRGQGGSSGTGSIPDTFALWKRSMAEAGYDLIGQFGTQHTIQNAKQILLSKDGTQVYAWQGALPKNVPVDGTLENTGGVGPSLWLDVSDEILRNLQQQPDGAEKIGERHGGNVQSRLDELSAEANTAHRNLYRYKLLKTLPLNPPLVAAAVAANGYSYLYPQAFCYGRNGDIFITLSTDSQLATWVVKYNASGAAVSIFKAYDGLSEVANFYSVGATDYYVTGGKGTLRTFDVTNLPLGQSAQTPVTIQSPDVYFGGSKFDNERMLLEEWATPVGTVTRRNRLFVYNLVTGLREQSVTLPLSIVGFASGGEYDWLTHKTQGFAATGIGIYLSHGKMASGTETDVNHALGVSLMTWQGTTAGTALITAATMAQFLRDKGLSPTRIENEGITVGDGGFANLLHVYLASDTPEAATGGIAISSVGEPFGYTDLSYGYIAPLTASYYGKSKDGLKNPYTGETMDTMAKIFDYMVATDTKEYSFYTGTATVTDIDGTAFPGSTMVRIFNQNNYTFMWETINGGVQTWWVSSTPYSKTYMSFIGAGAKVDLSNMIAGSNCGRKLTTGNGNALYGPQCAQEITTGIGIAAFGQNAGRGVTSAVNSSFFGRMAGWYQLDGVTPANYDYCSAIGYGSMLSGNQQIQLGNPGTTPYAYAALQIRSDERDKADVEPTELGDEFVDGLVAIQGRYDFRDSYIDWVDDGVDEDGNQMLKAVPVPRDGSRKGVRKHQWFGAGAVNALCNELGVDFDGYQDHSINGGADVKTLAYTAFIPPLTAYVQRRKAEIRALEGTVATQQGKIDILSAQVAAMNLRLADAGL